MDQQKKGKKKFKVLSIVHIINPSKIDMVYLAASVLKFSKARPCKPLQCMQTAHEYVISLSVCVSVCKTVKMFWGRREGKAKFLLIGALRLC